MYVSVSNLHFPVMKLVSEKPPEAVLEGVIFIFLGEHAPRLWCALHAILHPLCKFGQTGFFLLPTALHMQPFSNGRIDIDILMSSQPFGITNTVHSFAVTKVSIHM